MDFEALPAEIRVMILQNLIQTNKTYLVSTIHDEKNKTTTFSISSTDKPKRGPIHFIRFLRYQALLHTLFLSKVLLDDTLPLLYGLNTFIIAEASDIARFISTIGPANARLIKHLCIQQILSITTPTTTFRDILTADFLHVFSGLSTLEFPVYAPGSQWRVIENIDNNGTKKVHTFDLEAWSEGHRCVMESIRAEPGGLRKARVYVNVDSLRTVFVARNFLGRELGVGEKEVRFEG